MLLDAGARVARGRYRLLRPLASGGMGQVWHARSETTGASVALKVLRRADGPAMDARFRNEARLAAGLAHRNIVRVFDLLEDEDGTLVLVMELLRGESLATCLARRGTLSTREALSIVLPVLSALGYAHAAGVVHRDVTPANVFLSVEPDGEVLPKLLDFGIAKVADAESFTLEGAVLGTPRYMAPEQIRAAADIDGRADLFSVAAVAYELCTGMSPFAAPTPAASLAAVLEATVDPDPRIEPRVAVELQRALAKRPYQRHKDALEMADALRVAIGETDAALAALLRREPPRREDAVAEGATGEPGAGTSDGQSLDAVQRGGSVRRWGVASMVAMAVVGTGAFVALRTAPTAPRAATGTASPTATATATTTTTAIATATATTTTTVAPTESASAIHTRMHRPARPVATTPGF